MRGAGIVTVALFTTAGMSADAAGSACEDAGPWPCNEAGCPGPLVYCEDLRRDCTRAFSDVFDTVPDGLADSAIWMQCKKTCNQCEPAAAAGVRRISLDDLVYTDVDVGASDAGFIGTAKPDVAGTAEASSEGPTLQAAVGARGAIEPESSSDDAQSETPRGSLRATLKRLGVQMPKTDDEVALRTALSAALSTARMPLLRGLLFERGGVCTGCTERPEYVAAVLSSLRRPLEARHALPLFLYDAPLLPHTSMKLHLYEPRYKLLCRKALKAERLFGFVTGSIGSLARIKHWRFTDDDATDGSCHVTVVGLRRFKLGRQWQDHCAGCSSGPLHFADVVYFNDTASSEKRAAKGVALVKESLRLHHALVDARAAADVEEQVGASPTQRDRGYAMSFWLAAACAAIDERCRAHAPAVLASTSTIERLEKVLKVQRALAGQQFTSKRRRK